MLTRIALFIAALMSQAHAAPLVTLADGQTGRIEFESITPPDRFQYARLNLENTSKTVVHGDLYMPRDAPGKVPALIYSHGSTGVLPHAVELWVKAMNDAGIAVFVVDTFGPRNVGRIANNQFAIDPAVSIADALHGLRLLSTHPKIDATRIFNIGFSRGGGVAFATAWPLWQRPVDTRDVKFAGHIPVYPGGTCEIRYRADRGHKATAPIFMALGADDTSTNEKSCLRLASELAAAGAPIITKSYSGARHGWDVPNPYGTMADAHHGFDCDMELDMVDRQGAGLGQNGKDLTTGRSLVSFADWNAAINACMKKGPMTYGGHDRQRLILFKDVIDFVKTGKVNGAR